MYNKTNMFRLRNVLNIIFILGAIAGMIVYFKSNHDLGIIIILCAMAFKFIESAIRLIHIK